MKKRITLFSIVSVVFVFFWLLYSLSTIDTKQILGEFTQTTDTSEKQPTPTESVTPTIQERYGSEEVLVVARVIDGDTIEGVLSDGRNVKVRYIGIDTPETVDPRKKLQCFGKEASQKNKELVEGKTVRLQKDVSETDRFGRLLRYVFIGERMVNEVLVEEGYAYASTYPPDIAYSQKFLEIEQTARKEGRGLWGSCPIPSPN